MRLSVSLSDNRYSRRHHTDVGSASDEGGRNSSAVSSGTNYSMKFFISNSSLEFLRRPPCAPSCMVRSCTLVLCTLATVLGTHFFFSHRICVLNPWTMFTLRSSIESTFPCQSSSCRSHYFFFLRVIEYSNYSTNSWIRINAVWLILSAHSLKDPVYYCAPSS
jgi:hypothetical protein